MTDAGDSDAKATAGVRRRRGGAGALVLAAALGLSVAAPPAAATTEPERLEALRDLQEGNRLFDAGDYVAALALFERAYAKVPSPKLFFNFGQVHRRLGRTVEALEFYERYLNETPNPPAKLRAEAQQRIGELQELVATLEIRSEIAGHEVTVDGHSYGATPLPRPVRVAPGPHQIVVVRSASGASGAPPFVEKVVARAGQHIIVDAHDAATRPAAAPAPAAPIAAAPTVSAAATSARVPAVSASPSDAGSGGGEHRGRFGLRLRADVDPGLAGAGAAAALDYGVLEHLALSAGAFRWPVQGEPVFGVSAGVTASLLDGGVRPLLAIEGQTYFATGAHLGAHAAAGVQWDMTSHAGLYAMAGVQYTATVLGTKDGTLFFVPSLGLHLRL